MSRRKSSNSWDVIRSFLPEQILIERRDADALWEKYLGQMPGGLMHTLRSLVDFAPGVSPYDNDITVYEQYKRLGSLCVESGKKTRVGGSDGRHAIRQGSKKQIQLYLEGNGISTLRTDLATAAYYIAYHPKLMERKFVTGVTYAELGRLFTILGFRPMPIEGDVDQSYCQGIQAAHQTFCAFNNKGEVPFEVCMVYLPTPEFVDTFRPDRSAL